MNELNPGNYKEFLERFEKFDGVLMPQIRLDLASRSIELWIEAFDTLDLKVRSMPATEQYKSVVLRFVDVSEFAVNQTAKESIILLVDGAELLWIDGRVYFVGDPLSFGEHPVSEWTVDSVRKSTFYFGGGGCSWSFGEEWRRVAPGRYLPGAPTDPDVRD